MKKHPINSDPHLDRERAKYDNPIPSREFILDLIQNNVGPMTHEEIAASLHLVNEGDLGALGKRLRAMVRDGQLASNRRDGYGTLDKLNLIKGRVIGHPEGFGFVSTGEGDDIYLSSRQMRRVFDGDDVLVRISGTDRRGRAEGSLVEVLSHNTSKIVGRFFVQSGVNFVRPDNPRISQDIIIAPGMTAGAEPGQMVLLEVTRQPSKDNPPLGAIIQVLGEHRAPGMEIILSLHNYKIPHEWPKAVEAEVAAIPDVVQEVDKVKRVDVRHLPFVTIDGEDAKDFDDAVYCEPLKRGGWRLYVAIADVSHYVLPGSPLDREAWNRGTSVYFPGQVVPMLPEKLSNGLCSLKPREDRLCMVCEMTFYPSGDLSRFQFFEGVMHSQARLTYTQVASMIAQQDDAESVVRQQFADVLPHIEALYELYLVLRRTRDERGAIDFETGETRILFDAERKIQQIIPEQRTDAHKLIEECMLAANVCAATLLEKSKLPALYRVHEGPSEERLEKVRQFLAELGLGLGGGDSPSPLDYQVVLDKVSGRPDAHVIQTVLLRSMSRAEYRAENEGHFGLNYEAYTHFTSPIRRYPDLLVHRAIRALLWSNKKVPHLHRVESAPMVPLSESYGYDAAWVASTGEQSSFTERRADEATRDVETWLKCEYLLDKVGEEYSGVVTAVVGFGLFVELQDLFVEGLIHITGLPKDYYYHEPVHHRLVGERTRRVFRLGDVVRVKVSRVDLEERKVDFELVEVSKSAGKRAQVPDANPAEPAPPKRRGKGAASAPSQRGAPRGASGDSKPGKDKVDSGGKSGSGTGKKSRRKRR